MILSKAAIRTTKQEPALCTSAPVVGAISAEYTVSRRLVNRQAFSRHNGPVNGSLAVRDIPLEAQTERIAYVEQNNFLFDETVMENIRKGKAGATDEEVINAAKAAGCDEFIRELDKGYQTVVGSAGGASRGGFYHTERKPLIVQETEI